MLRQIIAYFAVIQVTDSSATLFGTVSAHESCSPIVDHRDSTVKSMIYLPLPK
jgi:hypothetical protein